MESDKQSSGIWSSLGGGSLLAVVLVALGFTVLPPAPVLISHPGSEGPARAASAEGSGIEARLWQDPLASVSSPAATPGTPPPPSTLQDLASALSQAPRAGPQQVLVAMVRPGSWAEAAESRRRTRVAVVTGLLAEDYVAADAGHLQQVAHLAYEWYLPVNRRGAVETASDNGPGSARPTVLLLWMPETALLPDPAASLLALRQGLSEHGAGLAGSGTWAVLGPADSGVLDAMLARIDPEQKQRACVGGVAMPEPVGLHFFTAYATKPVDCAEFPPSKELPVNRGLIGTGITRFTATDRQLAVALAHELAKRGISPFRAKGRSPTLEGLLRGDTSAPDDAVAVVTEADTAYGRAMSASFCRSLAHVSAITIPRETVCEDIDEARQGYFHFSYLRGLNGEQGAASGHASGPKGAAGAGEGAASPPAPAAGGSAAAPGPVLAEGNPQSDYLLRLADQLSELDRQLRAGQAGDPHARHAGAPRGLRAVGLLGTDLYDKLMLLRALKPRLPDTVFFTTDLDARLLDDPQLPYTRNLVLASGYDLIPPLRTGTVMPGFRDTYQSATYLATRVALRRPGGVFTLAERACLDALVSRVHVYEIGRRDLVEFSQHPAAPPCATDPGSWTAFLAPDQEPSAEDWSMRQRIGLSLSLFGLLFTGAFWTWPAFRRWMRLELARNNDEHAARLLLRGFALLLGAVVVVAVLIGWGWPRWVEFAGANGEGQPFLWASGLSIWPPLLLLALALGVGSFFTLLVPEELVCNLREQHEWLGFSPDFGELVKETCREVRSEPWGTRLLRDFLPVSMLRELAALPARAFDSTPQAPPFWRTYLRSGLGAARFRRLLLIGLLVAAVVLTLNDPVGNHLPLRGPHTALVYTVVNNLAMYMLLLMMAVVAEASLFCADFLEVLPGARLEWPHLVVQRCAGQLGVSPPLAVAWLQLQLAARRSAAVTPLIYLPFLFLAVLIVSHSNVFSPWHASVQQNVVIGTAGLVTVFCAWRLRRAGELVRSSSLEVVDETELQLNFRAEAQESLRASLERMRDAMQQESRGALAPFGAQPWLRALLPPLLSFASSSALDAFGLR